MSRGPEDAVQRAVKHLYTLVGAVVYDLSQGYRPDPGGTRQTPGLPDLWGFLPLPPGYPEPPTGAAIRLFWHEVKTEAGIKDHHRLLVIPANLVKRSQARAWARAIAQRQFGELCQARGIPYAIGGVEEAKALLLEIGLAHKDQRGVIILGQWRAG